MCKIVKKSLGKCVRIAKKSLEKCEKHIKSRLLFVQNVIQYN